MRDGLINNVGLIVSGLVSLVLVPFLLNGLGEEAYGLWVSALLLEGILNSFDFGLGATVTKEVAAGLSQGYNETTQRLVRAATSAQVIIAVAGGVLLGLFGFPLRSSLQLSASLRGLALPTFFIAGLGFVGGRLMTFTCDLLGGLRRFDLVNLVVSFGVILRAAGVILLLRKGFGLLAVAGWYTFAVFATAFFGFLLIARIEPWLRFGLSSSVWKVLAPHANFGLGSQIATGLSNLTWSGPPLIIGVLAGTSAEALFYVGQKFPVALSGVTSRVAGVLFPAASEQERTGNLAGTRDILDVGTRWLAVVVLPIAIVLAIVAPALLRAWLGHAEPEAILVLRLTVAAVVLDALGEGAFNLLWGRGAIRRVLKVQAVAATVATVLTVFLLKILGLSGAAMALGVAMAAGTAMILAEAARECRLQAGGTLFGALRGLFPAAAASAAAVMAVHWLPIARDWAQVAASSFVGGVVFLAVLYGYGSRPEERVLLAELVGSVPSFATQPLRAVARAWRFGK
jgi:O-antigen/teichoic acid export membrane protein